MRIFLLSRRRRTPVLAVVAVAASLGLAVPAAGAVTPPSQWTMFGQSLDNNAFAAATTISSSNVATLRTKWTFTTGGDVSARAAVSSGVAYVPDWSGHLDAIRTGNGSLLWSKDILADYLPGAFTTPPSKTAFPIANPDTILPSLTTVSTGRRHVVIPPRRRIEFFWYVLLYQAPVEGLRNRL